MKHLKTLLVGAGLLVASTGLASAQSYNLNASIVITKSCTLPAGGSVFTLGFPNSGSLQGQTIAATGSTLNVNCTAGTVALAIRELCLAECAVFIEWSRPWTQVALDCF